MTETTAATIQRTAPANLADHNLVPETVVPGVLYEKRPIKQPTGEPAEGLYTAWITLDNPKQYNSYTTEMVKGVILAFRAAANARDVVAVVFTGAGDRAFCTGGNTKEYAEYYAGNPQEYRQYLRLFNDMVSAILGCDKPVICRVNGLRVGGGQEIGMACDFTIAQDLANFGQAGPKHGSAAIGGATDFLPVMATDGNIRGPAGDGLFAPVTRDDIAAVATVVLLDEACDGTTLDLTGPDLITMADAAALLTEVTGSPVRFVDETLEEAYASRASYGAPGYEVTGWVTSYLGIAVGDYDRDGIPNRYDRDANGDGVPDRYQR